MNGDEKIDVQDMPSMRTWDVIDQVADRFERVWRDGPRIEDGFLADFEGRERRFALRCLLEREIECRAQRGGNPTLDEYFQRFPRDEETIREALRAVDPQLLQGTGEKHADAVGHFGRYALLEKLGSGGFGTVWRAKDPHHGRDVALKIFHRDVDAGQIRGEVYAVAKLRHSNIAHLNHFDCAPDGTFYIEYELIEGTSLKQHLQGPRLAQRRVAEFVQKVAAALHHAHGKDIIHRDLKPANIMVDTDGDPRIVDFGLARRMDQDLDLGDEGDVLGTFAYMSPEQAAGRSYTADPRTDIWALGVLLYELLTGGRLPFEAETPGALLEQIATAEPKSLNGDNAFIPRDLEAVCLKCLEKDPQRRYGTALEVADELQRFLTGEPVKARPLAVPVRFVRWCNRNRLGTAVIGLLAMLALVATIGFIATRIEKQRADQNADLARQQGQLALETLQTVVFEIQDKLQDTEATHGLRQSLLDQAIEGLDRVKVGIDAEMETAVDRASAAARQRMGDTYLAVGRTDDARDLFTQALVISQRRGDTRSSAVALEKLGSIALASGNVETARRHFQQCFEIRDKRYQAIPSDFQASRDWAVAHERLGDLNMRINEPAAALDHYQSSFEIFSEQAQSRRGVENRRSLAVAHEKLGDVQFELGSIEVASDHWLRTTEIRRELLKSLPSSLRAKSDLAIALEKSGKAMLKSSNVQQATELRGEALELREDLAAREPYNVVAQRHWAISQEDLGDIAMRANQFTTARERYEESLRIRRGILEREPHNARAQREVMVALNRCGQAASKSGNLQQARQDYQSAGKIARDLFETCPDDPQAQLDLAYSHERLGDVCRDVGQTGEARNQFRECLRLRTELAAATPDNVSIRRDTAIAYTRLGDVSGDTAEKERCYQQAFDIRLGLASADPDNSESQRELALAHDRLAGILLSRNELGMAKQHYQLAHDIRLNLAEADHADIRAKRDVAVSLLNLGMLARREVALDLAEQKFESAKTIFQDLVHQGQENTEGIVDLAGVLEELAVIRFGREDWKACCELYGQAIALLRSLNRHSNTETTRRLLGLCAYDRARAESQREEFVLADQSYGLAIETLRSLADDFPEQPDYFELLVKSRINRSVLPLANRRDIPDDEIARLIYFAETHPDRAELLTLPPRIYNNRGNALRNRDPEKSLVNSAKSLDLWQRVVNLHPESNEYRQYAAGAKANVANNLRMLQRSNAPDKPWQEAVEELYLATIGEIKSLDLEYLAQPEVQSELAQFHQQLAGFYREEKRWEDAEKEFSDACRTLGDLSASQHQAKFKRLHAVALGNRARLYADQQRWDDARTDLESAVRNHLQVIHKYGEDARWRLAFRKDCGMLVEVLARLGKHREAITASTSYPDSLRRFRVDYVDFNHRYGLVGTLVNCLERLAEDQGLADDTKGELASAYVRHICSLLEEAIAKQLLTRDEIVKQASSSTTLSPLRQHPAFQPFTSVKPSDGD